MQALDFMLLNHEPPSSPQTTCYKVFPSNPTLSTQTLSALLNLPNQTTNL